LLVCKGKAKGGGRKRQDQLSFVLHAIKKYRGMEEQYIGRNNRR